MAKNDKNTVRIVVLVLVILLALGIAARRMFSGREGDQLTPEQRAEQERWQNMTPEQKDAETRKEMQEMGVPPEQIEDLIRKGKETGK